MNRETLTHKAAALLKAPATTDATGTTDAVDLQGFDAVEVIVAHGAVTAAAGANTLTIALSAAPDGADPEDVADFVAVPAADLVGAFTVLGNGVGAGVQRVGYIGSGRYLRATITEAGTASAVLGAVALLDLSDRDPANAKTPATYTPS